MLGNDHIKVQTDQFGREVGNRFRFPLGPAILDDDVRPLYVTQRAQALPECLKLLVSRG